MKFNGVEQSLRFFIVFQTWWYLDRIVRKISSNLLCSNFCFRIASGQIGRCRKCAPEDYKILDGK